MTRGKQISTDYGTYFVTITCFKWLPLIEKTQAYDAIYKQFNFLKKEDAAVLGYVIMPNHFHFLVSFKQNSNINSRIGRIKRFLAYDIIKCLNEKGQFKILGLLKHSVNDIESSRGKIHQVFEPSFDIKRCYSVAVIKQKLNYMHNNPCKNPGMKYDFPEDYYHSSAKFYSDGTQNEFEITHFSDMDFI